ncbi:hypothetical protein J6590_076866 [Homalodisca vitripennis]|nr:hypothetical protein J6590_076866 [Homalodisca vitripennis]
MCIRTSGNRGSMGRKVQSRDVRYRVWGQIRHENSRLSSVLTFCLILDGFKTLLNSP